MSIKTALNADDFWSPQFEYEHREDGSIIMAQKEALPEYLPTLADYLDKWANDTPTQIWIARRYQGGEWQRISYSGAQRQARAIGASLLEMELGPDRPLMILSENSLEHALLGIACAYVGIPYAPISPAYSLLSTDHQKLKDITTTLEPGAVFADDGAAFAPALEAIASTGITVINHRNPVNQAIEFNSLLEGDPSTSVAARRNIGPATVLKYLFTSGSTGSPKAVINTNEMVCSMQAMVRDCYRFLEKQPPVVLNWAPWHHTAAGNKVSYLVLTNGGNYYIDDGRPIPARFEETLRNLREIACTWYFNVPTGWDLLVDELERDAVLAENFYRRLGMMFYAGAGMAQHTWNRLRAVARQTTGHEVLLATGLGATETAPFSLACTDVQENAGNVGVPSRGLSMKLIPTDGKYELRLKGPSITPGYYKDPVKTAEAFDEEGYYRLGDALKPADPNDFSKGFFFDGRIAENFKLTTGTWVAVGSVRAKLVDALGGLVKDVVIVGENQSELGALLVLSPKGAALDRPALKSILEAGLAESARAATGSASRVRRAIVLDKSPSFDRGETTDKGSLNQRAMRAHNAPLIAQLYQSKEDLINDPEIIRV